MLDGKSLGWMEYSRRNNVKNAAFFVRRNSDGIALQLIEVLPVHSTVAPSLALGLSVFLATLTPCATLAVSPVEVQQGKLLFEREWPTTNPMLGSDGLGPLFNANSCVACHHQGGVGGGGDSRFNAVSLGIESVEFKSSSSIRLQRSDAAIDR